MRTPAGSCHLERSLIRRVCCPVRPLLLFITLEHGQGPRMSLPASPCLAQSTAWLLCSAALSLIAVPAAARDDRSDVTDEDSSAAQDEVGETSSQANTRRTFTPENFARFAPRTALDMARQIPGFSIQTNGGGERGLGQADTNVLINGRRISGKSNGPVDALGRIPAEEVVRLELVDGASLDIGGLSGQVLNVVTASTGRVTGQFRYAPRIRSRGTPARLLEGSISLAGGGTKDEWTLALANESNRRGNDGIERVFDAGGSLIDTRIEASNFDSERPNLSGSYTRIADNGNVLSVTGEVGGFFFENTETSERSGTIDPVDRSSFFTSTEDEFNFEIGLDYEFGIGAGKLKLIGLHRYENSPTESEIITNFADDSAPEGSRFERVADEFETIGRAEYSFNGLGGNLVLAAEGARNILDIEAELEVRDEFGVLQPEALDGASARVDENRGEISATYSRPLTGNLQFQTSLGGEFSEISQSGPFGLTRSFVRPKGFVALDWKASESINLSGRLERDVGQLNFFDFLSSVDLNQDRANATNAELVPQQSWVFELEANIGLGAIGSVSLRGVYEDITDRVDQIPIADGGQAPGNIPAAEFYEFSTETTLLSEGIGWRGTRLDITLALRDSSLLDPLLGTPRPISRIQQVEFSSEIRHDIPDTSWALGGNARWQERARNVRIDEVSLRRESFGFVAAFVENKDVAGLTVRATVGNLANQVDRFDRTVFIDRAAGLVDVVEDQDRTFGTIFTLEIEGSF